MRVFNYSTLKKYWQRYSHCEQQLKAWHIESIKADWSSSADLKKQFKSSSIINSRRVVFNIKGNDYRLLVDIEFSKRSIFVVWFGTHNEYNKIDVEKISYED